MTKERLAELRSDPATELDWVLQECLDEIERLQRLDFDIVERYAGKDGTRYWASGGAWLMPGQALAVVSVP